MNITQFSIEEVRCFAERQNFEIRPLTFLVGENSTGKTTALACFQALADYLRLGNRGIDFNRDPYAMGIFRDIVKNSRKKDKVFKLGFTFRGGKEDVEWVVEFSEIKRGFEPSINSLTVKFTDGEVVVKAEDGEGGDIRVVCFDEANNQYNLAYGSDWLNNLSPLYFLHFRSREQSEGGIALTRYMEKKRALLSLPIHLSVFSTSPIRSNPQRTYNPTRVFDDPGGSDVPMYLMQLKANEPKTWEALKEELVEFGKRSGMFENIEVKNLASPGGPFQLRVKVRNSNSNIIDVGYGVSQILPILVQTLDPPIARQSRSVKRHFLLLQQPEVHLHPRAQAELSTLMATLAAQRGRAFIVETHSDYMIDRARIEIRKGTIRPEDVSLIYLEPKGRTVKVHNISFDKTGDMISIPNSYREFFMKEVTHLMGFEG